MRSFFPYQFTNFWKVISHCLTNFAVNRNHLSTVMSEVEILSSFARNFCRTAQNFVHSRDSSVQRSEQSVFIVSKKLHHQSPLAVR